MVAAFSKIEAALQKGIALGLIFNLWNADVLREINGAVRMVLRLHTEKDIEGVFAAGKILERYGYVVPCVEAQVETQCRLRGRYGTSQVFADIAGLKHGQIGIKDVHVAVGASQHHDLTVSQPS